MDKYVSNYNNFVQSKLLQTNLDLKDVIILDYIIEYNKKVKEAEHIVKDDISYVYISHDTFIEDLPILKYTRETWKNKLYTLKKDGWILSITKRNSTIGTMSYYAVSDKCLNLLQDDDGTTSNLEMTSYNNIINNTNTDIYSSSITSIQDIKEKSYVNKTQKKSRYDKLVDIVNAYTTDDTLRKLLYEHVKLCLEISRTKGKTMYANQYKGILRTLDKESDGDLDIKRELVELSNDRGWISFYADSLMNKKNGGYQPNRGIQMQKADAKAFKDGAEAKEYTENLQKEYMKSGRRAVF